MKAYVAFVVLMCLLRGRIIECSDTNSLVEEFNRIRRLIPATNMNKLSWDNDVQDVAQKWADKCQFDHPTEQAYRKTDKYSLGQIIAAGTELKWTGAIKMWYDEVKSFRYGQSPVNGAVVGHYTQMVWASSTVVGCAHKLCPAKTIFDQASHFYVCNFGPAGNVLPNQYKPYEPGTRCSKCPRACDNGLCSSNTGTPSKPETTGDLSEKSKKGCCTSNLKYCGKSFPDNCGKYFNNFNSYQDYLFTCDPIPGDFYGKPSTTAINCHGRCVIQANDEDDYCDDEK